MKLKSLKKIRDGKYLKNYELNYTNKAGRDKKFEIVSYHEIEHIEDLGKRVAGFVIVALREDQLLLLREFRMGVNRFVYNLCAGRLEENETYEECIRRELHEETGLNLVSIVESLPPAYAAVSITDTMNQLVIVRVSGELADYTGDNELIEAAFYTKSEVSQLLKTKAFSSRAQAVSFAFIHNAFDYLNDIE